MSMEQNRSRFAKVVGDYVAMRDLQPAEQRIVDAHRVELTGARILDLGMGAGRTTSYLVPLAGTYVGLDYVPELVEAARAEHPEADIRVADARDLAEFDPASFDVVVFSFNGIDCVGHDDRALIVREIRRVLSDGGLLILSSHNRDYQRFNMMPWHTRRFGRRTVARSLHALRYLPRHLRLSRQSLIGRDWAIINDDAHDWGLLNYYVTIGEMHRQLAGAGFGEVAAYDVHGERTTHSVESVTIYYTARADGGRC